MKKPKPSSASKPSKKPSEKPVSIPQYDHLKIEQKWQKFWNKNPKLSQAVDGDTKGAKGGADRREKLYMLVEFPFPSGAGLHAGHVRSYTALDIIARKNRMMGKNVMYPIGWDAFGLPTENYAIKTGVHPSISTKKNTDNFARQLKAMGFSFDWSRTVDTTDPNYYKWTQWIFLQFLKKGLAYRDKISINWCPKDKIGLANEEVVGGCCERCGTKVEKREKEQWMLAITKYADRLDKDLDDVDYPERVKIQQRNWIGKSEGAEIDFAIEGLEDDFAKKITAFTTRADTLFGVTYMVLAPELPLVQSLKPRIKNWDAVEAYIKKTAAADDAERTAADKEKTGVVLEGVFAIHPATKEKLPVWIADYVLATYGTGAVMAVPAHDERDFKFAKKYDLEVKTVVAPSMDLTGQDGMREGFETVERDVVDAIIENQKGEFLLMKESNNGIEHYHFVGGGTDGEDDLAALKREVVEECGYDDFEVVSKTMECIHASGFRHTKNRNQRTEGPVFHVRLKSDHKVPCEVEDGKHEILWVPKEKVASMITFPHHAYFWNAFVKGPSAYIETGKLMNSGEFNGTNSEVARKLIAHKYGRTAIKYKLRDWVFSRQRYWGEPIPVVHCAKCGIVPLPESQLPLVLPKVKKYEPTDNGESPLAAISSWVNTKCPTCKGPAKRETDTMPNWAGSSWYYLRYMDPKNKKAFADPKKLAQWSPVDWYNGGMEHTTLHLLYSRFWHKFLFDQKLVPTNEPYAKRTSHGLIMADDGTKMSKSKGNVVNPDDIIKTYGADTLRLFEMFIGPFDQAVAWNSDGLIGPRRFIERVFRLTAKYSKNGEMSKEGRSLLHKTIQKVNADIDALNMNTAVSSLMILSNQLDKEAVIPAVEFEMFLALIAPFMPHAAEEMYEIVKKQAGKLAKKTAKSVTLLPWPQADMSQIAEDSATITVQVNGKIRAQFQADIADSKDEKKMTEIAASMEKIKAHLEGLTIRKTIFVPGKIVNFVAN